MATMGFRVHLAEESFNVEPGVAASIPVEITNEGTASVKVEITVEGIDPEWIAMPVSSVEVPGGESVTERAFLKPPREPESLSGTYPFAIRVSRSDGDEAVAVPCSLVVKPFHNVSVDVQPRRAEITAISRTANLQITVMNLGNVEHTLRLSASDPGEMFTFEFAEEEVAVAPGAQKSVNVTVAPVKHFLLANARLQQFTVTCRSRDERTVATATHAQIEQRALVTPAVLWLFALMVFVVASFIVLLPRNPVIDTFTLNAERQWMGEPVIVKWSATNARSVTLEVDGRTYDNLDPTGTKEFLIDHPEENESQVSVKITAFNGRRQSDTKQRLVFLRRKEPPAEPEIIEFTIEPIDLFVDQTFRVNYRLSESVTEAFLLPTNLKLDPKLSSVEVVAKVVGEYDYQIVARNAAGQSVEKSIRVTVKRGSKASIIEFRAEPPFFDPLDGRVTLTWQVTNAARIEIVYENGRSIRLEGETGPMMSGTRDEVVTADTIFTLKVWDDEGVTTEKQVTVRSRITDDFLVTPPP